MNFKRIYGSKRARSKMTKNLSKTKKKVNILMKHRDRTMVLNRCVAAHSSDLKKLKGFPPISELNVYPRVYY